MEVFQLVRSFRTEQNSPKFWGTSVEGGLAMKEITANAKFSANIDAKSNAKPDRRRSSIRSLCAVFRPLAPATANEREMIDPFIGARATKFTRTNAY